MSKPPNRKPTTNASAQNKPSSSTGATASATKSSTQPIPDPFPDAVIGQHANNADALKDIRGQLVQSIGNAQCFLKQLEKDLSKTSKPADQANLKKRIVEQQKLIVDFERRRDKAEKLYQAQIEKVEAKTNNEKLVKSLKLQAAIPKEMQKLAGLSRWPIIMDEIGNLKTFYRVNELLIDFDGTLTKERVQIPLQRAFFGLSFNPDGSIHDHRTFTIPDDVNRLIAVVMNDEDIGRCIDELKRLCDELHPDLFETVFVKANTKESGRDNVDRMFMMTQTPDDIRHTDYYKFGAHNRTAVPFMCVWMTKKTEIPNSYDDLFGPRFQIIYD